MMRWRKKCAPSSTVMSTPTGATTPVGESATVLGQGSAPVKEPGGGRLERYLAHLDDVTAGLVPEFLIVPSTSPDLKDIIVMAYEDLPEPGFLFGVTYGLSREPRKQWTHGRPELSICVKSTDLGWATAIGCLAEAFRDEHAFSIGSLFDVGEPITSDTAMDGFLLLSSSILDREDTHIDVGDTIPINLIEAYPTYASERAFIQEHGIDAFFDLEWEPYDVTRPPAI